MKKILTTLTAAIFTLSLVAVSFAGTVTTAGTAVSDSTSKQVEPKEVKTEKKAKKHAKKHKHAAKKAKAGASKAEAGTATK